MSGLPELPQLPDALFPHQRDIVAWALSRGRAAVFASTGLGKSLIELCFADAVHRATGGNVILLAPPAVAAQLVREAARFGIAVKHCAAQSECVPGVTITNYQKLHLFDRDFFVGGVLDESSILKSFDGKTRNALCEFFADMPYRLAASATPAPNDYTELGNHSEFLGIMPMTGMLATFFTHDSGETSKWRLKGYADREFWEWVCSWAVLLRKPSDLGYDDSGYDLPPLTTVPHELHADGPVAASLSERLRARRATVDMRVAYACSITPTDRPFVWWCNLNDESSGLARGIPGAVEVSGSDAESVKERKLIDFSEGRIRVLVTKPSICGFGMNWQHCDSTGFVGLSDSFEQQYQAVRRFWRFGQTRPVVSHLIYARTEGAVMTNLIRKQEEADAMAAIMTKYAAEICAGNIRGARRTLIPYNAVKQMEIPTWLR